MKNSSISRRQFLKAAAAAAGARLSSFGTSFGTALAAAPFAPSSSGPDTAQSQTNSADYTLRIGASAIEIAPKRFVSVVSYNGQFPGPLIRFKEGERTVVDIYNNTDLPELVHWHGQMIPSDVDGAASAGYAADHAVGRLGGGGVELHRGVDDAWIVDGEALQRRKMRGHDHQRPGFEQVLDDGRGDRRVLLAWCGIRPASAPIRIVVHTVDC